MLLNPAKLTDENLLARVELQSAEQMRSLGRSFASVINPNERISIGFVAKVSTGKTTLASGFYEGLGSAHGYYQDMMVSVNGYCDTRFGNNALIRHFDLAVQPEDDDNIPHHWRVFEGGLSEPGAELVEHAMRCCDDRYSIIFKLEADPDTKVRTASIYAAPNIQINTEIFELSIAEAA